MDQPRDSGVHASMFQEMSSKIPVSASNTDSSHPRKRNSLLVYSQSSRLPLPINSCNNINSLLNSNTGSDPSSNPSIKGFTNIYSSKRLSMIHNNHEHLNYENNNITTPTRTRFRSPYRYSMNIENVSPSKDKSSYSNIPTLSNLSLGSNSKIPRSPSMQSVNNTPLKMRNNNSSILSNQSIRPSTSTKKITQLKFSYYTKQSLNSSLPHSDSLSSINTISNHPRKKTLDKSHRLSTISSLSSIVSTTTTKESRGKIRTMDELFNKLLHSSSTKTKFSNSMHTSECFTENKSKPYVFEELSSKRPDMFEKLTMYERIMQYPEIYFTGLSKTLKIKADLKNNKNNHGFDDRNGNYILQLGDHIKYKYQIKMILGKGAFGSVISAVDHSTENLNILACKIIKNDPRWSLQAVEEIKILKKLDHPNILKYVEHFTFRSHMCIVTELLGITLYESIQVNNYKGFSLGIVRQFTKEILKGISYIHSHKIIHCDLKPENIMISNTGTIKIIDFGSSCCTNKLKYSYLQSRFYRSPEVLLGGRYDNKIDIWSIALISIELFAGLPLLQPQTEWELFQNCVEYFNIPSRKYILQLRYEIEQFGNVGNTSATMSNTLLWKAFDSQGGINTDYIDRKMQQSNNTDQHLSEKRKSNCRKSRNCGVKFNPGHGSLKRFLRQNRDSGLSEAGGAEEDACIIAFLEFLERCLVWNKRGRATADECLQLEFFTRG